MSVHTVEINFDELKFNLYDLLGIKPESNVKKIKKAFRTLVLKFHPDKNNIIDEEIYNHLTLANQVLTDENLRNKYDTWLKSFDVPITHEELKLNYDQERQIHKPNITINKKEKFNNLNEELNKKHGCNNFDSPIDPNKMNEQVNQLNDEMYILNKSITKEQINNNEDFNDKFTNRKIDGSLENQLIPVNKNLEIMELNKNDTGAGFLSITNYDMLYSNDGLETDSYSGIEQAFSLLPNVKDLTTENNRDRTTLETYTKSYDDEVSNMYSKPSKKEVNLNL
jgi:curved DNA-binding protein CbpA